MNLTEGKSQAGPHSSGAPSVDDDLVVRAVQEYLALVETGQKPDRLAFANRYPQIAEALAECLAGLDFVQAAVPELSDPGAGRAATRLDGDGTPAGGMLGEFRIVREVGRGGMGIVYEAEQMSLGRRVALKVLPFAVTLDGKQLQRFKNEAQAAAHLQHQNIVPVHSVGCERGVHFYAMQFIEGQSVAAVIADLRRLSGKDGTGPAAAIVSEVAEAVASGRLAASGPASTRQPARPEDLAPPAPDTIATAGLSTERSITSSAYFRTVACLGEQAAEALEHAHQLGVVHRDIKPANLLVDIRGNLWIADFGLAQFQTASPLTLTGDLIGTLRYMSPEQAQAKRLPLDHRTDIYSLGVTLYELLALEPAFPGDNRHELLRQIAEEEPHPPRRLNKAIPAELATIVGKAMEKNPADRYATAQELADDLRRFLEDKTIQARRPTLRQHAVKWARRHKPVVWSAAVVLASTLAMLAGTIGWAVRDRETRRAETERVVEAALHEEEALRTERKYPEALSAARRAAGLLAGGEADEELRRRVEVRLADQEMIARLEDIRLQTLSVWKGDDIDYTATDRKYAVEFRGYGIDVENLPREEAVGQIKARAIRVELAIALDDWAITRKKVKREDPRWKQLFGVARAADGDSFRNQLRGALERRDRKALEQLASSASIEALPAPTMVLFGQSLLEVGSVAQAVAVLRVAQRLHPGEFWINHELGWTCGAMQPPLLDEAVRFNSAALAVRPGNVAALIYLGTALQTKGAFAEAEATLRQAIALKPDLAFAYNFLGAALREQHRLPEAVEAYRKAIALKPDDFRAHYELGVALRDQHKLPEADEAFRKAIDLNPGYVATRYINFGIALRDQHKLPEAVEAIRKAIDLEPNYAYAYTWLGHALRDQHKLPEADEAFRKAIDLEPNGAALHYNLGGVLRDQHKLSEAVAAYRKAIELRPDFAKAYKDLGDVLLDQNDVEEGAIRNYKEALQINPGDESTHFALGEVLRKKGDRQGAIREYKQAPNNVAARVYLANALRDEKDVEGAIREYHEALRLNPNTWLAHYYLANILRDEKNDVEEAIRHYQAALRINPKYALTYLDLGVALSKNNYPDRNIPEYKAALDMNALDYHALNFFGHALQRKGKLEEAISVFKEAISVNPHDANAHYDVPGFDANVYKEKAAKAAKFSLQGARLALKGQWKEAAEAFERGLALDPSNYGRWWQIALLHLQCGDLKGYHRDCKELVQRFGETSRPQIANWVAKLLVLPPEGFHDLKKAIQLSERAVSGTEENPQYAWFVLHRGIVEYRAGHYQAAMAWLEKAEQPLNANRRGAAFLGYVYLYRAMVQAKNGAGDMDQARASFQRGVQIVDRYSPRDGWTHWIQLHIARAEAEALLKGKGTERGTGLVGK